VAGIGLLEYTDQETISTCELNFEFSELCVVGIALSIFLDESARAAPGITERCFLIP
jgi:hypothetical protein